ncbi:hypothetical protein OQA88_6311 [Cercophora sp. LCS_1]
MNRNSAITSFFKPIPKASPQSSSQSSQQTAVPPARTPTKTPINSKSPSLPKSQPQIQQPTFPSPLPPTPSPPRSRYSSSPPAPVRQARDRSDVIQASDDEDGDSDLDSSDDDLPDLFKPSVGSTVVPAPPGRKGLLATPRAKRTAIEFHSSPLTIMTKHKFDINALMKHAEADNALEESEKRMQVLLKEEEARSTPNTAAVNCDSKESLSLHDTMMNVFSDPGDSQEGGVRTKLLRAVKRTEVMDQRIRWHFFEYYDDSKRKGAGSSIDARPVFPDAAATGDWSFLADPDERSAYFEDGVPFNIQTLFQNIPDEILLWVLKEIPFEGSKKLRDEYIRLLSACQNQTRRLIDSELVDQLFREAGAGDHAFHTKGKVMTGGGPEHEDTPYSRRNWTSLKSVLCTLYESSQGLELPALTRSVSILLRLGMDDLLREDELIVHDYQAAMTWLVESVPEPSWDALCADVTLSLYTFIDSSPLRLAAISSVPITSPRLVDLRRRLALSFVFDDTNWGRRPPYTTLSIRSLIDRLEDDAFIVDRHHTDYVELGALAGLLDIAIGDGCPPTTIGGGTQAIKQFNAEIDELARKIKVMWSGISTQGAAYASRLDTRQRLQDLERTLVHATRTRPPPMQSIFGIGPTDEYDEDKPKPRQQSFMQRYLIKGAQS